MSESLALTDAAMMAPASLNPMAMIAHAVNSGASIDMMEKLLALQERWEANEARKAFTAAMAAFKANPPEITKDKAVAFNSTKYRHATLGNVCSLIAAGLADHGISHRWTTEQAGDSITVTCILTHSAGHSESVMLSAAADKSGQKNAIQQIGSAITYLQRYTLLSATGLATMETDDDGAATTSARVVGAVHDPAAPVLDMDTGEPAPRWQELHPKGWQSYLAAMDGALPNEVPGDRELGKRWATDRGNPALCAWAAGWIIRTQRELRDVDWEMVADAASAPHEIKEWLPADLWRAAAWLRKARAAQDKEEAAE